MTALVAHSVRSGSSSSSASDCRAASTRLAQSSLLSSAAGGSVGSDGSAGPESADEERLTINEWAIGDVVERGDLEVLPSLLGELTVVSVCA